MFLRLLVALLLCLALPSVSAARLPAAPDSTRTLTAALLRQLHHAGPLSARAEADFNGDGILDHAELSGIRPEITIYLSGASRLYLPLLEPAVTLAAVDLDRDGDQDLVAVTGSPRVLLWWNRGSGSFDLRLRVPRGFFGPLTTKVHNLMNSPPPAAVRFVAPDGQVVAGTGVPSRVVPGPLSGLFRLSLPRGPPALLC